MLSFKQFVKNNLFEAKISHFSHIGLDPNNQEHKDLVDAYNAGVNRDPDVPKNPNQIKTFDQLKNSVSPYFADIQRKRQEEKENKKAFENKDAELIHHDPKTGLKVFKVKNSSGCVAAGDGAKGCVYDRETGNASFKDYDSTGENSHIIHTPEKGNLSRISIIGVKPGESHLSGKGGNFQDKGNKPVSDSDWQMLRKKYNLDNIKVLHGIRNLGMNDSEARKSVLDNIVSRLNHKDEEVRKSADISLRKHIESLPPKEVEELADNHPNERVRKHAGIVGW